MHVRYQKIITNIKNISKIILGIFKILFIQIKYDLVYRYECVKIGIVC